MSVENKNRSLLKYWEKLEYLNPVSIPKDKKRLYFNNLPWSQNSKNEFEVYLGTFSSEQLFSFIREYFSSQEEDPNEPKDVYIAASIKIDSKGNFIEDSFQLSLLPFALDQLKAKIEEKEWEDAFEKRKKKISEWILTATKDENDNPIFLDEALLVKINTFIQNQFTWNVSYREEYFFTVHQTKSFKKKEDTIVNSLFTKDLKLILNGTERLKMPTILDQYLAGSLGERKQNQLDINKNIDILKRSLVVDNYPDGCWPSEHTLSMMQQFAVNYAINELGPKERAEHIYSVNGPPGSGKTTLLRDIIAANIVNKAKAQSTIKDPQKVYQTKDALYSWDNKTEYSFFPVEKEYEYLKDFGMVISSSNNGAVENVTKELPQKKAIEGFENQASYFSAFAEVHSNRENWGLISAVLGNGTNIGAFCNTITDPEKGMLLYLDKNRLFDLKTWDETTEYFHQKLKEVELEKKNIKNLIKKVEYYASQTSVILKLEKEFEVLQRELPKTEEEAKCLFGLIGGLNQKMSKQLIEKGELEFVRLGFWHRLFKTTTFKKWRHGLNLILHEIKSTNYELKLNEEKYDKAKQKQEILKKSIKNSADVIQILKSEQVRLLSELRTNSQIQEDNFIIESFWTDIQSKKTQERCPWYLKRLKQLQSELFLLALKVNEVFIHTANGVEYQPISNNLQLFVYLNDKNVSIKSNFSQTAEIWANLFQIVPVLSSTFASIQTMFSQHLPNTIPWLFVDEAGQALPQMACGAIWRAKRAVIVGDPLQIEPVNTMPAILAYHLAKSYGLDGKDLANIESVQNIADNRNKFGANIKIGSKEQWIGTPLKVHRRCINPMFDIANAIAYNNSMVCSTIEKEPRLQLKTGFLHIEGKVTGRHYVPVQGEIVLGIIEREMNAINGLPSLYVISPFSEVARELTRLLTAKLPVLVPSINEQDLKDWLGKSIGTVHTFQGKEADGVILCLGCDETKLSAAKWASSKPNILNVAITRSKYRFQAIGDKNIWLKLPFFKELTKLPSLTNKEIDLV